jgi:hypothetical protein
MSKRCVTRNFGETICIPNCEASRRLGKKQGTLAHWHRDGCPDLDGEALIVFHTPNDPKVRAWREEKQIDRIVEAMTARREAFTYPDGVYLTYKGAWRRHRMPRTTLRRLAKAGRVATRKRAYVSARCGKGRGKFKETLYREKDITEYQRTRTIRWDGVSTDGDSESLSLTAASRESGIDRRQLWKHIKKKELAAELCDPPPGQRGRGRPMYKIARQQLREFCARLCSENTQRVPTGWESESQISERLSLNLEKRIELSRRLREGRENGTLHPVRIKRATPPHRRVWHYDPREVNTLLAQPTGQTVEESLERPSSQTANDVPDPPRPQSDPPSGPYPGHVRKPHRRGPRPDEEREVVLQFCYDEYVGKERPASEVLRDAQRFGQRYAPKSTEDVRSFSWKWSEKWTPTLPWRKNAS